MLVEQTAAAEGQDAAVEGQQDRQLDDEGQTAGEGADAVLLVELPHLLRHALLLAFVALAKPGDLRLQGLHGPLGADLAQRERDHQQTYRDGEQHDGDGVAAHHILNESQNRAERVYGPGLPGG